MKIKKLTGILLAGTIAASYLPSFSFEASAIGQSSIDALFTTKGYASLADWIEKVGPGDGDGKLKISLYAPMDSPNTCLSYANIQTITDLSNRYSITIDITFFESNSNRQYSVEFNTNDLKKSKWDDVMSKGEFLDLSLSFFKKNKEFVINANNIKNKHYDMDLDLDYTIFGADIQYLLGECGLITDNIYHTNDLALYNSDTDDIIALVNPSVNLNFTIDDSCRMGVYVANIDDDEEIFDKSSSTTDDKIYELVCDFIGIDADNFESLGFRQDRFSQSNTYDFIMDSIAPIKKKLKNFYTQSELEKAANSYLLNNKAALINAIASDIDFTNAVDESIEDILGEGANSSTKSELGKYIEAVVAEKVTEELSKYDLSYKGLVDTIKKALEDETTDLAEILTEKVVAAITGGKDLDDYIKELIEKENLNGEDGKDGADGKDGENGKDGKDGADGKDGVDGKDGESFEAWMLRNYGSLDSFLNQIGFEAWAKKNYGSVENFISKTAEGGLSAYDIAVEKGYFKGTEKEWLESLQGASAYEIAVENGFKGTEKEWLESLKGEDGEDGRDGEDGEDGRDGEDGEDGRDGVDGKDGKDGQIIYVNGTYGQVTDGTANGDDVIIIPDSNDSYGKPSAGNVNPATGVAAGVLLPAAAIGCVALVKKQGRKRGRK